MRNGSRFLQKRSDLYFGTVRSNAFFRIYLYLDNRGTVRAFDFFRGKTEKFRQKIRYASRKVTASVIKILTENGRVRYGTIRCCG
jgi:hypothetical protein